MSYTQSIGQEGEDQAAAFLQRRGLRLVERHYFTRWGEIDLIFCDRDTLVFVEVKTRASCYEPSALDAITPDKQKKIIQVALSYVKRYGRNSENMRFDVVTLEEGHLEWYKNAFGPEDFYTR